MLIKTSSSLQSILLLSAYLYPGHIVTDRGSMLKHRIENVQLRLVETRLAQTFFCPVAFYITWFKMAALKPVHFPLMHQPRSTATSLLS